MKFNLKNLGNYQAIPTTFLKEKSMTLKAKGLLTHIYSLPNDWDYTIAGLCKITGTGIKQIRSTIEELELFGYLKRKMQRKANGQIDYEYIVYINPLKVSKRKSLSVNKQIEMEEWRKKM